MGIGIEFKKLRKVISKDEKQKSCLVDLAKYRLHLDKEEHLTESSKARIKQNVGIYLTNGVFYLPPNSSFTAEENLEELEYLGEEAGSEFDEWGVNEKNAMLFRDGFMIPALSSEGGILFYLNYHFMRDKAKKYLNVYTDLYERKEQQFKLYGMENTKAGFEKGYMVTVEGVFDKMILQAYGVPVTARLGTAITDYQTRYYGRFRKVVDIPDNDYEGAEASKRFRNKVTKTEEYRLPTQYKDIDDFYTADKPRFEKWVKELKERYERKVVTE